MKNHSKIFWIIINALFLFGLMFIRLPVYLTPDDHLMVVLLAGGKGCDTSNALFLNIILSKVLWCLFKYIPIVNWFTVAQELIIFLGITGVSVILNRKSKNIYLSLFLIIIVSPYFYYNITFSLTALVGFGCGTIILMYLISENIKRYRVLTIIYITISFMFRELSLVASVPFFSLIVFLYIIKYIRKNRKIIKVRIKQSVIYFVILFSAITGVKIVNSVYKANVVESERYQEINYYRQRFHDYNMTGYGQISKELSDMDISENDYALVEADMYDEKFFSVDILKKIENTQIDDDKKNDIRNILYEYSKVFGENPAYYSFFIIAIIAMLLASSFTQYAMTICTFLIYNLFVIILYYFIGRLPYYINYGLLFMATLNMLYSISLTESKPLIKEHKLILICCLLMGSYIVNYNIVDNIRNGECVVDNEAKAFFDSINDEKENFYIADNVSAFPLFFSRSIDTLEPLKRGYYSNFYRLCNWDRELEVTNEQLKSNKIDNPIMNLLDENVYFLSTDNGNQEKLIKFWKEHYKFDVGVKMIREVGSVKIYKFEIIDN